MEREENQLQVSLPSHSPWKSLPDSPIPSTPTTGPWESGNPTTGFPLSHRLLFSLYLKTLRKEIPPCPSFPLPSGSSLDWNMLSAQYRTELPGAPDGEYVVIQYEVSYENKKAGVETVTPILDKDGKWRVSGYFIR